MTKVCNKCRLEQSKSNFSKDSNAPDGIQYTCKDCVRAYNNAHREHIGAYSKKYIATHKEHHIEYAKQYYVEHKEVLDHKNKAWRENNKEEFRKSNSAYYEAHRDQIRESGKQYYVGHKETLLQQNKVRRNNNKDADRKVIAIWRKNHPEARKVTEQARRAKKAGLVSTLTREQWEHILDKFNNACAYCGIGDKTLHQDHFVSISSGGEFTHNNIIPACVRCNSSKGTKDFFAWYPTSDGYDKRREKRIMKFLHYTGASQQLTLCMTIG